MITPFEVYLVMQLNAFSGFFHFVGALVLALIAVIAFNASMNRGEYARQYDKEAFAEAGLKLKKMPKYAIIPLVFFFIGTAIPSSKTAAAMIILPALTSKEVIDPLAKEGKELYALAKQALRDAVDAKPEPTPEAKK